MIVQSQETIPVFQIGHGTLVSIGFRDYRRHELTHGEALFRFLPSILIPFGRKFVLLASLVFCFQSLLSVFELNRMKPVFLAVLDDALHLLLSVVVPFRPNTVCLAIRELTQTAYLAIAIQLLAPTRIQGSRVWLVLVWRIVKQTSGDRKRTQRIQVSGLRENPVEGFVVVEVNGFEEF